MNELVLDFSVWRCGGDGENKVGEGTTALLNDEGFYCCLGQFSKQLQSAVTDDLIREIGEPYEIRFDVPDLNTVGVEEDYCEEYGEYLPTVYNTALSDRAIGINDDQDTTPEEKIKLLTELFRVHNYQIKVINKP